MRGELRAIAIEITGRGFAFAVLEGPERLVDWGGREVKGDVSLFLAKLERLIERYRPDLLVLEEPAGSRRGGRAKEWLAWAEELAAKREVRSVAVSRDQLGARYAALGASKHEIATGIALQFPELAPYLPKPRRPWQSEPASLGVFIAVARGLSVLRRGDRAA